MLLNSLIASVSDSASIDRMMYLESKLDQYSISYVINVIPHGIWLFGNNEFYD